MTYALLTRSVQILVLSAFVLGSIALPMDTALAAKKKPSIVLTAPKAKSTFAKEGAGIIPIAWSATNVPEDTLVILELESKKLAKGSVTGGGTWQDEIAAGDSTGSYNWDIEGEGRPDAGTYRVRALLQECVKGDCSQNPFFPGMKKTKTYAKSKWVNVTIAKSASRESDEAADTISSRPTGSVGVVVMMEGRSGDSFVLQADSAPTFNYYPSGDVESCTITAYYEGGDREQTHGWKNGVKPGQYGRFTFSAVGEYPLKKLESVEVVCGNSKYRASDTLRFTVEGSDEAEAPFKIITGKSGTRTYKKGEGTKSEAESYCKQAYNDSEIHRYTRVQCYFDGERFEDVRAFKG
jgi:hypothetical protein